MNYLIAIIGIVAVLATSALAHGHGHGHSDYRSDSMDIPLSDRQLVTQITSLLTEAPTSEIIRFLSALNSTDGQVIMRQSKQCDPAMVSQTIKQLTGNSSEVAKGKNNMRTLSTSFRGYNSRQMTVLRQLYKVYIIYINRQMAKQVIMNARPEVLKAGLSALAAAEQRHWFGTISFSDLLKQLNQTNGRQAVIDALTKWIDSASYRDLERAGKTFSAATWSITTVAPNMPNSNDTTPAPGNSTTPFPGNFTTTIAPGNFTNPPGNFSTTTPSGNFTMPPGNFSTTTMPSGNVTMPPGNFSTTTVPSGNVTMPPPLNFTTTMAPGFNASSPAPIKFQNGNQPFKPAPAPAMRPKIKLP